tara:strand:- start:383 stop:3592 length:3210 start_codon:yes stop_codon:yes gene_type:complete
MKVEILFVIGFFAFLFSISGVSAGCCEEAVNGSICQDISNANECVGTLMQSTCQESSSCQIGCCVDEDEGTYDPNVPRSLCSGRNSRWEDDVNCNIPGADIGCCKALDRVFYVTGRACDKLSEIFAVSPDFTLGISEAACISSARFEEKGACVFSGGGCDFTTSDECLVNGGEFSEGYLCTAPDLNTTCEKTEITTCVENKDGVYFVDSCGNIGNIYDADKIDDDNYWDTFVPIEDSCGYGDGNANSESCGNCNRFSGGVCGSALADNFNVKEGDFYCKYTGCDFNGVEYLSGESWCDYDGAVGFGDDLVGSRHWKYACSLGDIDVEPCRDYRQEICIQKIMMNPDETEEFSISDCEVNEWRDCLEYNDEEDWTDTVEKCEANPDCFLKQVFVGDNFNVTQCAPNFPPGLDMEDPDEDICSIGDNTCSVRYVKTVNILEADTDWECESNCECETINFTKRMNDVCRSMGDCGGYLNIEGDVDDAYSVDIAPRITKDDIKDSYSDKLIFVPNDLVTTLLTLDGNGSLAENVIIFIFRRLNTGDYLDGGIRSSDVNVHPMLLDPISVWTISELFGAGDKKWKDVNFVCKPWQPIVEGEKCELCNNNTMKPCSRYRCESLGAGCKLINVGTSNELCFWESRDDNIAPDLSPTDIDSSVFQISSVGTNGFTITNLQGGCLDADTDLSFGITTNKPSQCVFALERKEWDEMDDLGTHEYAYEHILNFSLPDPSHGESQGVDITADFKFYIKCRDGNGNEAPVNNFYEVDTCVNEGNDTRAVIIKGANPVTDSLLSFNSIEKAVTVYTNEAADCKWSLDSRNTYDEMGNSFTCRNDLQEKTVNGFVCSGVLPINSSENNYYIKCKDQPWLEALNRSDERNENRGNFPYVLKKPANHISITRVQPSDNYEVSTQISTVTLKVETAGGGEEHSCDYSFTGYDDMRDFNDFDFNTIHEQVLNQMTPGDKKIYIECSDETGDSVQGETEFRVVYDSSAPQVARVFQSGSSLTVITTEPVECVYSDDPGKVCGYSFSDGESMGIGAEHSISVVAGKRYYIKCKDEHENVPSGCSIIVRAT